MFRRWMHPPLLAPLAVWAVVLACLIPTWGWADDEEPIFLEPEGVGVPEPAIAGTVSCRTVNSRGVECTASAHPGYLFHHFVRESAGCDYREARNLSWCSWSGNTLSIPVDIINGTMNGLPPPLYVRGVFQIGIAASANPPEGGSVSCSPHAVFSGDSTTCTPQAALGWRFDHFSGDCSGSACAMSNITAARAVVAHFVHVGTHEIATSAVPPEAGGTVTCSPNPVSDGDSSRCTGTGALGWVLTDFSGDCSGPTCVLDNVGANRSVTGHFSYTGTQSIAAQADPSTAGSVSCTPNPATLGGRSTCTASPFPGHVFSGFSGDCTGSSCLLDPVGAHASVTAHFTALPTYPVNIALDPPEGGAVNCTLNPVYQGGTTTCQVVAHVGYAVAEFRCTTSICGYLPYGAGLQFNDVTAPVGVLARFTRLPHFTVTAHALPANGGSVTCAPTEVTAGGSSTCTAVAQPGFRLAGFSGDCGGKECVLSNVTADRVVTALFSAVPVVTDSGQTQCHDGQGPVACTLTNSGDDADYPRQDARFGRDAQATAGRLGKVGTGPAGFDYTRIAVNGAELGVDAQPGDLPGDWGCTRDNVTGRTWEVKTVGGWRHVGQDMSWSAALAHAAEANQRQLCGHADWRLPTRLELSSIVDYSRSYPAIDPTFFPNTQSQVGDLAIFWSSDRAAGQNDRHWYVVFSWGSPYTGHDSQQLRVRLVRGGGQ